MDESERTLQETEEEYARNINRSDNNSDIDYSDDDNHLCKNDVENNASSINEMNLNSSYISTLPSQSSLASQQSSSTPPSAHSPLSSRSPSSFHSSPPRFASRVVLSPLSFASSQPSLVSSSCSSSSSLSSMKATLPSPHYASFFPSLSSPQQSQSSASPLSSNTTVSSSASMHSFFSQPSPQASVSHMASSLSSSSSYQSAPLFTEPPSSSTMPPSSSCTATSETFPEFSKSPTLDAKSYLGPNLFSSPPSKSTPPPEDSIPSSSFLSSSSPVSPSGTFSFNSFFPFLSSPLFSPKSFSSRSSIPSLFSAFLLSVSELIQFVLPFLFFPLDCLYMYLSSKPHIQKYTVIVGSMLVHIALGTVYTWGNLSLYVLSYMKLLYRLSEQNQSNYHGIDIHFKDSAWVVAMQFSGMAIGMPIGGKCEKRFNPRITIIVGGIIMSSGVYLSQYMLQNYYFFIFFFGIVYGFGLGFAYTSPLVCSLKWFPEQKGLVSGLITAGFGMGSLIFTPLQNHYLNPHHKSPTYFDEEYPSEFFFDDVKILSKIPQLLTDMSLIYFFLLSSGALFLQNPLPLSSIPPPFAAEPPSGQFASKSLIPETSSLLSSSLVSSSTSLASSTVECTQTNNQQNQHLKYKCSEASIQNRASDEHYNHHVHKHLEEEIVRETTIYRCLKTKEFWVLWSLFFINGLGIAYTATFWRVLSSPIPTSLSPLFSSSSSSSLLITNKQLSAIGSLAAVANASGRILWGNVSDAFTFQKALIFLSSLWAISLVFLPSSASYGPLVYGFTVCTNFFCLGGNFSVFPTATASTFGKHILGELYGFVFASQLASSFFMAFATQRLSAYFGTGDIAYVVAAGCLITCIYTLSLPFFGINFTNDLNQSNEEETGRNKNEIVANSNI